MVEFSLLEGTLYVGEEADPEMFEDNEAPEYLYSHAVFKADHLAITFYANIGGNYPVKESHLEDVDGSTVYYPHLNETTAEVNVGGLDDDLSVYAEDVHLEYATVNGSTYIRSQCEVTAYGGVFMVIDGELYKVRNSLLAKPEGSSEPDEFLGIGPVEEPVGVQNIESGYAAPVTYDRVDELMSNDEANGALKLREPDSVLDAVSRSL